MKIVSTDQVNCGVCGKMVGSNLANHLRIHHINSEQYRKMFPGSQTILPETSLKFSVKSKQSHLDHPELNLGLISRNKSIAMRAHRSKTALRRASDPKDSYGKGVVCTNKIRLLRSESSLRRAMDPNSTWGKICHRDFLYTGISGEIVMRSSWEVELAKELDNLGYLWEYQKYWFNYYSLCDGEIHRYNPDFYIPILDMHIEVKPFGLIDDVCISKCLSIPSSCEVRIMHKGSDTVPSNWCIVLDELQNLRRKCA